MPVAQMQIRFMQNKVEVYPDTNESEKARSRKPAQWQYRIMRNTFRQVNKAFGVTIKESTREKSADLRIALTTFDDNWSLNGDWSDGGHISQPSSQAEH